MMHLFTSLLVYAEFLKRANATAMYEARSYEDEITAIDLRSVPAALL